MVRPRAAEDGVARRPEGRPPGPPPPGCHDFRREGAKFVCVACGRAAKRVRWTALAYSDCTLSQ
eukprot:1600852-Lingulodinium_polyedra.AAC.1